MTPKTIGNMMTPSPDERPQSARRLRPRARALDPPRSERRVNNEYPVGYLAQLARPFTSRRAGAEGRLEGALSQGRLTAPVR